MIKSALTTALLLTLCAGTGLAGPISINFAQIGAPIDITSVYDPLTELTSGGWTDLNSGIQMIYQIGNDRANGSAMVSRGGIDGVAGVNGLNGLLSITFPIFLTQGLLIDYTILPIGIYADGAAWTLSNGQIGTSVTDATGFGQVFVASSDITTSYNSVQIYFTLDSTAKHFNVSQVFGDVPAAGVPEPGTYALFGSGLLLLGFGSRKLIKRRS